MILSLSLIAHTHVEAGNMKHKKAIFAGGCFWCIESSFDNTPGVIAAVSGYTGGKIVNPTYKDVSQGTSGHVEAIEVTYDPEKVSYEDLLTLFWKQIDPTDQGGQFADRGNQYATAIFYLNEAQKKAAEISKRNIEKSGLFDKPIVTKILQASTFYPAEEYHQDFYQKEPQRYKRYHAASGREQFLKEKWQSPACPLPPKPYTQPTTEQLRKTLTPLQFTVTQMQGTEPPFRNAYWDNKREGIYVDLISGEPLFSSKDKFDSASGWPSFTKPLDACFLEEKKDTNLARTRTEVSSRLSDAHLGHVFSDGPAPTGLRYCMNSAAMRFIPKEDLKKEGYGEYAKLFEQK